MGDRWYQEQGITITDIRCKEGKAKPKRKLKKDYIAEINQILSIDIVGLEKCTIDTLNQLVEALK